MSVGVIAKEKRALSEATCHGLGSKPTRISIEGQFLADVLLMRPS